MSGSMAWRFIRKDLYFNRGIIGTSIVIGFLGLALVNLGDAGAYAAVISFVTAVILSAVFICMHSIFAERKERALAFALSFPISPGEYFAAKVIAAVASFIVPCLAIGLGGTILVGVSLLAHGLIPISLTLGLLFVDQFCLMLAVTLFSNSDRWIGTVIASISISTSFYFYFILRVPSIHSTMNGPAVVWSDAVIGIIAGELAVMALIAAVVWFFLARRRDFI